MTLAQAALELDGRPLSLIEVEAVARSGRPVRIGDSARRAVDSARAAVVEHVRAGEPIYGVNTGFGSLAQVRISDSDIRLVQRNLVRSHAAGVGAPLPDDVVRAMLLILAASLCRGRSGVRIELIELIAGLLNHQVTPIVPSRGSVGASGDLAPLAHAALVLIGEGQARHANQTLTGGEALAKAGLKPIALDAKEGLALINGTHMMAAIGSLVLCDVARLRDAAVAAAAMAIDACRATDTFLDDRIHEARHHAAQRHVAEQLRRHLAGSTIVTAHKEDDPRVQDPYCLRAAPQVLGAAFETIEFVRGVFERELGAVTDNPLVFADGRGTEGQGDKGTKGKKKHSALGTRDSALSIILSGGNFHGMPLAIALDCLKIALCHVAGIAERRVNWLLAASDSENPVNIYLSPAPGLHSGLMIAQYTAAACCNELQTLAAPASVANIPTSAGMEDYNSMGATSAHQARAAIELAVNVIAIELLVMTEAMEYQRPLRSGAGVEKTIKLVRAVVPRLTEDRPPAPDIAAIAELIRRGEFETTDKHG